MNSHVYCFCQCAEQGIKIAVKDALGATTVLMNHPIFKIAFVCNQGKSVLFIAKRRMDSTSDQFKCHGFECTSTKTAKRLAKHMVMTCNSVFRKLRRTRKIVRKKTIADGGKAAEVTPAAGPCESEADRMRRELQAEVDAAKEYRLTLQAALADLDACEDDADGNDERGSEVDMDMVIAYEEYADEFAQISLELAAQAATSSDRRVLNLFGEGEVEETEDSTDLPDDVEDGNGFGESDEYMATRSNSI